MAFKKSKTNPKKQHANWIFQDQKDDMNKVKLLESLMQNKPKPHLLLGFAAFMGLKGPNLCCSSENPSENGPKG